MDLCQFQFPIKVGSLFLNLKQCLVTREGLAICNIQIDHNLSASCKFLCQTDIARRCRGTSINGIEIVYLLAAWLVNVNSRTHEIFGFTVLVKLKLTAFSIACSRECCLIITCHAIVEAREYLRSDIPSRLLFNYQEHGTS